MAKNRGVKTDISGKKAYLIPIVFAENAVFDVFDGFDHFSDPSGHLWFFTVFHCSGSVRFSHGFCRKLRNIYKIHEKHRF